MPQLTASHAPVAPRRQSERLVVPDVLRGVAILAMLVAHAGGSLMPDVPGVVRQMTSQLSDMASPLFALVMGMTAQIVLTRTVPSSRAVLQLQQTIRGLVLVALGVWLASWGTWVDIVLAYLGLLLIVGSPLLFLSTRWLVGITIVLVAISEPLIQFLQGVLVPAVYLSGSQPLVWLSQWVALGGNYRLINLLPMFLAGALLLRWGLPAGRRLLWILGVVAVVLFPVRPLHVQFADLEHALSGGWADTAHDISLVLFAYVTVSAFASIKAKRVARIVEVGFVPFRACGSIALSLYVVQIAIIAWWRSMGIGYQGNEPFLWLILVPGLMVVGVLWWRFIGLGPIEWLLGAVTGRYRLLRPKSR